MSEKRLIDASRFDKLIMKVPSDVFDEYSYLRGVEDVLEIIRTTPREKSDIDIMVDGKLSMHAEV